MVQQNTTKQRFLKLQTAVYNQPNFAVSSLILSSTLLQRYSRNQLPIDKIIISYMLHCKSIIIKGEIYVYMNCIYKQCQIVSIVLPRLSEYFFYIFRNIPSMRFCFSSLIIILFRRVCVLCIHFTYTHFLSLRRIYSYP